jgi:hypothetical protein
MDVEADGSAVKLCPYRVGVVEWHQLVDGANVVSWAALNDFTEEVVFSPVWWWLITRTMAFWCECW